MNIIEEMRLVLELTPAQKKDADARSKAAGYTKANVGSGMGKAVAGVAGHYLGKDAHDNPKKKADITKGFDRTGILFDKTYSMRQAKAAGKGAGAGAAAGVGAGIARALTGGDHAGPATVLGAGAGAMMGAGAGAAGSAIKAGYRHARKMGYGKVGRVGVAAGGPWVGLTTPKAQRA